MRDRTMAPATTPAVELLELIYEAVLEPYRWTEFLDCLRRRLDAGGCALFVRWYRHPSCAVVDLLRAAPSPAERRATPLPDHWLTPLAAQGPGREIRGAVANRLWARLALPSAAGTHLWVVENQPAVLALLAVADPAMAGGAGETVQPLLPHLQRGLTLTGRLHHASERARNLGGLVRDLRQGVAVVDSNWNLTWLNEPARQLVQGGHGVRAIGGRLYFTDPRAQRQYAEALADTRRRQDILTVTDIHGATGQPMLVHPLPGDDQMGDTWALVFPPQATGAAAP